MKTILQKTFFGCAILLSSMLTQQVKAQLTFQKTFGGVSADYLYDAHKTLDGGYILGGNTTSAPSTPNTASYLVRLNANGDTLWTESIMGTGNGNGTSGASCDQQYNNAIYQLSDSGFVSVGGRGGIVGCANIIYGGDVVRLDKNGNPLWAKTTTTGADPYAVIQSNDGNIVVAGYETGIGAGNEDGFIMKLDLNGDTLWSKNYGGTGNEWFYQIVQSNDGGYLAAGYTDSCAGCAVTFGQGGEDIYLVKTDASGNLKWSYTYGTAQSEYAFGHCLAKTMDGGYIVTGQGGNGSQSANGIFLLKIDSMGSISWSKYYAGYYAHAVKQTPDKGYAIVGKATIGGSLMLEFIKTDSLGVVQWSYGYTPATPSSIQGFFVEMANDGGYLLGGQATGYGAGNKDAYVVKTDANGNAGCATTSASVTATNAPYIKASPATLVSKGASTLSYSLLYKKGTIVNQLCSTAGINESANNKQEIKIYPNPSAGIIKIELEKELGLITVYNLLGEIALQVKSTDVQMQIDMSKLAAGVYTIVVKGKYYKIIKE